MRKLMALLSLLSMAVVANALVAKDGYVATSVFSLSDAPASTVYGDDFTGVEWGDMDPFALGPLDRTIGVGEEAALAVGAEGEIFALVYGYVGTDYYTGVIAYGGGGYSHVAQDELPDVSVPWLYRAGGNMKAIAASPVTEGRLTAGDVLVIRTWRDEGKYVPGGDSGHTWLEILDIDPDTGSRTLVHSWLCSIGANARLAVGSDGAIYVLQTGVLDANGDMTGPELRKLVWNGTDYDDSLLVSGVEGGVLVGPDGDLYVFEDHGGMGWNRLNGTKPRILRVDPDTGSTSGHAEVDGRSYVKDWVFDGSGKLRIALDGGTTKRGIATVTSGSTVSAGRGTIASWTGNFVNLAPSDQGGIYVAEALYDGDADVSLLSPDSSGGGGGKGKGK